MAIGRAGSAEPAYRRLSQRQARRSIATVAAFSGVTAATALLAQFVKRAPPLTLLVVLVVFGGFVLTSLLARHGSRRRTTTAAAMLGFTAMAASIVTELFTPLWPPSYTISFIGLIPIGIVVFAMWGLRAHVLWVLGATVVLVVSIIAGASHQAFADAAPPLLLGWGTGVAFSLLGQQAMERSRYGIYLAARRAHEARGAAARSLQQLQALEAIGRTLSEHGPTDAALSAAVQMLIERFDYAHPSIYLGDERLMRLGAQAGYDLPLPEFTPEIGVIGRVMRTRQAALVRDVADDPDFLRASPEIRSEVAVPLLAGQRFLGVVNVESGRRLGPEDVATVSIVADRIAAALDLAERRNTLAMLLDASPIAITAYGTDDLTAYWNRAATELFGWQADEVVGRANPVVVPGDPTSLAIDEALAAGRPVPGVEATRRHKDGHEIPVRIYAARIGDRPPYGTIGLYQDLTAERAAKAALSESETRFESVVGALREGVIVEDMDLKALWWNTAAERLLGVTADELAARTPVSRDWQVIREDGVTVPSSGYAAAVVAQTGKPVLGITVGVRHANGELRWLEADALPMRRGPDEAPYAVVTSLTDVTERQRHEDELAAAELQVRSVLEQAANPIVGVDVEGRITFANRRAEALFGWAVGELRGQRIEVLVPEGVAERHVRLRDGFLARPVARPMGVGLALAARRKDGETIPVEISISPVETPAGRQVYATIVDTGERRRVEAELLQAAKMDSIGRLAGGIAHDFNNLLTAIIGYGEIAMADLPEGGTVREEVGEMVKAAERASSLTRQLLGFARKSVVAPTAHDLNDIVSGITPFLARLLGEQVALVTNLDPRTGHVRVDRTQVDQILVNLAVNARDAMPEGGTLVIETTSLGADDVDAVLGVAGERVALLTVSDTGLGMTEETRAKAFEPFFTTKPFGEGTGLGLATTYGIVRGSGGAITVDTAPGAGTTFRIYLPEVEALALPEVDQRGVAAVAAERRTVLVVEDEESVRTLAVRMLERAGYHVLQAPNGAAAVSLVGTRLDEVDLLLTDVVMPGIRGPELYEVLRSARPDLPVVFMTGYSAGDAGALEVPADRPLVAKPFTADALLTTLAEVLP